MAASGNALDLLVIHLYLLRYIESGLLTSLIMNPIFSIFIPNDTRISIISFLLLSV